MSKWKAVDFSQYATVSQLGNYLPKEIYPGVSNLDDITDPGLYRIASNLQTTGYPEGLIGNYRDGATLLVNRTGTAGSQILFSVRPTNTPRIFMRGRYGLTWEEWKEFAKV